MILADTSVFVEFFRGNPAVQELQDCIVDNEVILHPLVELELALGGLRPEIAERLKVLPRCESIADSTLLDFINYRSLAGKGVGYVDCQILAASLANGYQLWTMDRKLSRLSKSLA